MTTQLHDHADPMQQCGYCLGWQREELWRRIYLQGDEDGCVSIACRECAYGAGVMAYLGWNPPEGVRQVGSVAELLAVGERHVVEVHS